MARNMGEHISTLKWYFGISMSLIWALMIFWLHLLYFFKVGEQEMFQIVKVFMKGGDYV